MGVTLHLGFDDSVAGDTKHCGKSFMDEIISPSYPDYFNLDDFLTPKEQQLLYPDYHQYDFTVDKYRHIEPAMLKSVFEKVLDYLKSHHDQYPLIHTIYDSKNKHSGSSISNDFQYKGYKCCLNGYHNDNNHRQEIEVLRFNNGWETFEWINASSNIDMDGKTFYIETENKYQQYKDILEELIDKCDQAIKADKKLFWIFSN